MIIIGAGLSGLLCGALNPGSVIYEAGPDRESDHKAVFRCKSDQISMLTGIPFKKVRVHKAIWFDGKEVQPTPRFAHMYSKKVTGTISARSIFDIESGDRYIPPADFVKHLKARCDVRYNREFTREDFKTMNTSGPIVSTMPMPMLEKMVVYDTHAPFRVEPIVVNQFEVANCDSYTTIYYPDPKTSVYRATLNGSTLIVESTDAPHQGEFIQVLDSMGITEIGFLVGSYPVKNHIQKFGKITPIDNEVRRDFIYNMTVEYGIYSLGRFACWRPKTMLDDVLEDIFHIRRLIEQGNYGIHKHQQGDNNAG